MPSLKRLSHTTLLLVVEDPAAKDTALGAAVYPHR